MVRSFICNKCDKEFSSNSGLWYHKKKCGTSKCTKIHKCPHCNYETQDLSVYCKIIFIQNIQKKKIVHFNVPNVLGDFHKNHIL